MPRSLRAALASIAVLGASLAVASVAEATEDASTCDNEATDGFVVRAPYLTDAAEAGFQDLYTAARDQPSDMQHHALVYVPESAEGQGEVPLVMTMHGLFGSAKQHVGQSQWQATADAHGFVLVAPNGHRMWDYTNGSIDTAWLRDVIADTVGQHCIDTARIYSTGHSMGGFMTHRVTCDLGDVFAAGASYAAGDLRNGGPCTPGLDENGDPIDGWERMSLGNWHGTDDGVVGYGAGRRGMNKWLAAYDCDTTPAVVAQALAGGAAYGESETWSNCLDGTELHFRTMPGHGHAWPDGCGGQNSGTGGNVACTPEPGTGPWPIATDLTEELWAFLSQHGRSVPAAVAGEVGPAPRLDQTPQVPANVAADGIESGVDSFGAFRRSEPIVATTTQLATTLILRFEYTGDAAGLGATHPLCPTSNAGAGTQSFADRVVTVSATDVAGNVVETEVSTTELVTERPDGGVDHEEQVDVTIAGTFDAEHTVLRAFAEGDLTKFWWSCGTPPVTYKETVGGSD